MPGFEEITRHRDPDPAEDPWVNGPPAPETITIAPYNPEWPRRYQALSTEIRTALRDVALDVEHVGSTSVEGLAAKSDTDAWEFFVAEDDGRVIGMLWLGNVLKMPRPSNPSPSPIEYVNAFFVDERYRNVDRQLRLITPAVSAHQ